MESHPVLCSCCTVFCPRKLSPNHLDQLLTNLEISDEISGFGDTSKDYSSELGVERSGHTVSEADFYTCQHTDHRLRNDTMPRALRPQRTTQKTPRQIQNERRVEESSLIRDAANSVVGEIHEIFATKLEIDVRIRMRCLTSSRATLQHLKERILKGQIGSQLAIEEFAQKTAANYDRIVSSDGIGCAIEEAWVTERMLKHIQEHCGSSSVFSTAQQVNHDGPPSTSSTCRRQQACQKKRKLCDDGNEAEDDNVIEAFPAPVRPQGTQQVKNGNQPSIGPASRRQQGRQKRQKLSEDNDRIVDDDVIHADYAPVRREYPKHLTEGELHTLVAERNNLKIDLRRLWKEKHAELGEASITRSGLDVTRSELSATLSELSSKKVLEQKSTWMIQSLQKDLDQERRAAKESRAQAQEAIGEAEHCKKEIKSLHKKLKEEQKQKGDLGPALSKEKAANSLQASPEDQNQIIVDLQMKVQQLEASIAHEKSRFEFWTSLDRKKIEQLQTAHKSLRDECTNLRDEASTFKAKNVELENEVEAYKEILDSYRKSMIANEDV